MNNNNNNKLSLKQTTQQTSNQQNSKQQKTHSAQILFFLKFSLDCSLANSSIQDPTQISDGVILRVEQYGPQNPGGPDAAPSLTLTLTLTPPAPVPCFGRREL